MILKQQECSEQKHEVLENQLCLHFICLEYSSFVILNLQNDLFYISTTYINIYLHMHPFFFSLFPSVVFILARSRLRPNFDHLLLCPCYETVPLNPKWRTQKQQAGFERV